ncbi:MAG TPA: YtxH domain-containing protein [Candidatus Saccharimonadia bacterium]|nr:YtxH domain-containing protein [Candidatus Saccharimonadia bacterium]
MRRHHNEGFLKGTIIGAIVGAVAGLLLAPRTGPEMQAEIKRRVKGTYTDIHDQLQRMSDEMGGRVDSLKEVAKDLKGEAREESQELIRRAEVLKQDLLISANNLARTGTDAKDAAVKDVKLLLAEGSDVMKELERVTRHLAGSAHGKFSDGLRGTEDRER